MAEGKLFRPRAYPLRNPTDAAQTHGAVVNPPRYSQIGGLDSAHKASGAKRNQMTLRKPSGTR